MIFVKTFYVKLPITIGLKSDIQTEFSTFGMREKKKLEFMLWPMVVVVKRKMIAWITSAETVSNSYDRNDLQSHPGLEHSKHQGQEPLPEFCQKVSK